MDHFIPACLYGHFPKGGVLRGIAVLLAPQRVHPQYTQAT